MTHYRIGPPPMRLEPHYSAHVEAMTAENLHAKAEIARELAWRDKQIEELRKTVAAEREAVCQYLKPIFTNWLGYDAAEQLKQAIRDGKHIPATLGDGTICEEA